MKQVAIIGAGIAGLACAEVLKRQGHQVRLFDKGRGPGGRMSTRRVETPQGQASFDHGAQYFTARDRSFQATLEALCAAGFASQWRGNLVQISQNGETKPLAEEAIYIGTPSMNAIIRGLAQGHDVVWGVRVASLSRVSQNWQLQSEAGEQLGTFNQVVCAVPAEQVAPLIGTWVPHIGDQAANINSLPCWTGMYVFESGLALTFDSAKFIDHSILDFVSANHTKPSRSGPAAYIVQATPAWSHRHLEMTPELIAPLLLEALFALSTNQPRVVHQSAHRWRYARVEVKSGPGFLYDQSQAIGACGDWLQGPRIESAWASGHSLGHAMRV